jgi:hypothetical protein
MCNDTTFSEALRDEIHLSLDELARRGAQRMLAAALQAEVDEYIQRHGSEQDENNHALVVRNGRSREKTTTLWSYVTAAAGNGPSNVALVS